ncbi:uncharacterized protein J4E79_002936 [Alternaria viburni]|uniref:uncharacterized protein n=1 Tax=Alternaria viburni TaxID=566460 RepID=UPI0020C5393C|nr:uncharacterized protein J4E79_002936 [Alternaria viburni]KAI4664638.1 hypothetical protein J4E79_002936 [Alternaria viburni]
MESTAISSTTTIAVSHFRNPQLSAEGLAPVETGHPTSHVSKRSLSSPYGPEHNGDVGAWLLDQIEDSLNPYGSLEQGRGTTGLSFPLEDTADDWHLVNLWGCTSVVVISRKRMFLTHIWEKPSMEQPQLFQSEVLDVLRNGSPEFSHPLTVFTVPGEGFENIAENKVRAFIITPYRDFAINPASDDINYPYEVDKIKNLLNNILGRNDAVIIPYSPAEENNRDDLTPKGKLYIQYDPVTAARVPAEGGCNQQQVAAIELWFEDAPTYRYRDTWQPFPDQVVQAKKRSVASSGKDLRLLRGREVTDADEAEWKDFDRTYSFHLPDNDQAVIERLNQRKSKPTALVDSQIITNFKVFFDVGDSVSYVETGPAQHDENTFSSAQAILCIAISAATSNRASDEGIIGDLPEHKRQ